MWKIKASWSTSKVVLHVFVKILWVLSEWYWNSSLPICLHSWCEMFVNSCCQKALLWISWAICKVLTIMVLSSILRNAHVVKKIFDRLSSFKYLTKTIPHTTLSYMSTSPISWGKLKPDLGRYFETPRGNTCSCPNRTSKKLPSKPRHFHTELLFNTK